MDYIEDRVAKYLAFRVIEYDKGLPGLPYELAVNNPKTTKESIDQWIGDMMDRESKWRERTLEQPILPEEV